MADIPQPSAHWTRDVSRRAVQRLRDALLAGTFERLIAIDPTSGELQDPDARALFASLPAVNPATAPDELVSQGLLPQVPKNLRRAFEKPKYRVGREVFVRTTVSHTSLDRDRPAGRFDPEGPTAFTHLAQLVGRTESSFWVEIEDAPEPLEFLQNDLFAWNEPSALPPQGGTLSGVDVDYNDPLMKAHICAAYLELADTIAALDFDHPAAFEQQRSLVYKLASRVRLSFSGREHGYRGARAGSLLSGGEGVSFTQRAVALAFLLAFGRVAAFDLQAAVGATLRLGVPHGFVILTLRPSMRRFVCDPTWREPLTHLEVAFFGPGWGHDRRLLAFEGHQQVTVRPDEIDLPRLGGDT